MPAVPETTESELEERLSAFLTEFLGSWPPRAPFEVTSSRFRALPGWDDRLRPFVGVASPAGTVVSVADELLDAARRLAAQGEQAFAAGIGALLGERGATLHRGVFRAAKRLVGLGEPGEWLAPVDPRLPEWLTAFSGEVLVAFDADGRYAAGVGLKDHHRLGREIAVGTEPEHRGRGLARALVAQASRAIYEQGAVATYLHAPDNAASAAVAEAAGFPDLGWQILGVGNRR